MGDVPVLNHPWLMERRGGHHCVPLMMVGGGANTKHQFACLKFGLGKVVGVTYSWFAFLPYQFSLW